MGRISNCNRASDIIQDGGKVIKNFDGTISVYIRDASSINLVPVPLNKVCCEALGLEGVSFDIITQKCLWKNKDSDSCEPNTPFNIVLNPLGNDGTIFWEELDEVCRLGVEFDYLFKFDGSKLDDFVNLSADTVCSSLLDTFENLSATMVITKVQPTQNGVEFLNVYEEEFFSKIGENNLYSYLTDNSGNTGFFVTCSTQVDSDIPVNIYDMNINGYQLECSPTINNILNDLFIQSGLNAGDIDIFRNNIKENAFSSNWKTFTTEITDESILSGITNEKIKLNIRISGVCIDFCVLVDNIRLDKKCSHVSNNTIFVSTPPKFNLDKVRDNKKSWVSNDTRERRKFSISNFNDSSTIRHTDYYLNNEKLLLNTKEIDLDISISNAIETDVWCYVSDNPCLLNGQPIPTTTCVKLVYNPLLEICELQPYCCSESCGDEDINLSGLLTTNISEITTIEDFEYYFTSELIDAKNRQTISAYPTLRLLYDRYMLDSDNLCGIRASEFSYSSMNTFSNLIGNYWVDLIEQVIPSTTLWGSTKIYGNTIFDIQKHKYRAYTTLFGKNTPQGFIASSPASGISCNAQVSIEVILGDLSNTTLFNQAPKELIYDGVNVIQINSGSEFISVLEKYDPCSTGGIKECLLSVTIIDNGDGTLTASVNNSVGDVTFEWITPTSEINLQTISIQNSGNYVINVYDDCCQASATFVVPDCKLSVTLVATQPDAGLNNGSISSIPNGQIGNLTYLWNNGSTTSSISGLSAGTYTLMVSDDTFGNCTVTSTITLFESLTIQAVDLDALRFTNIVSTTYPININWGNNIIGNYGTGTTAPTNVYPTPYTGPITLRSLDLSSIKNFDITTTITGSSSVSLFIDTSEYKKFDSLESSSLGVKIQLRGLVSELPRTLEYLLLTKSEITGTTNQFPLTLNTLLLYDRLGNTSITGGLSGLPSGLLVCSILPNSISGNTIGTPSGMTFLNIEGENTISGSVLNLPRTLTSLGIVGNTTIGGDTSALPTGLTYCNIIGQNTLSGNVSNLPRGLTIITVTGQNTLSGNTTGLPTGLTYTYIEGLNRIGGDVANLPRGLTDLYLPGSGTTSGTFITGNVNNLPTGLTNCTIVGYNEVTGNLANLPIGASNVMFFGNNTITGYTAGRTWASPMKQLVIQPNNVVTRFTNANIDNILFDLTGSTWASPKMIVLRGTGTTASDLAKVKLSGSTGLGNYGVSLTLL